jgi:hypothetical protein
MDAPEPLDDALQALLARERNSYGSGSESSSDSAWRRLELAAMARGIATGPGAVPTPPNAPPEAPTAKAAVGKLLLSPAKGLALAAAIAIGSGGLGYQVGRGSRPAPPKTEVTSPHAAAFATAASEEASKPAATLPAGSAKPVAPSGDSAKPMAPASAAPTTPSSGSRDPSNLASEQAQIDTARAALARGRPADALRSLGEHSRLYPSGKLREEREALAVQALAQSGQKAAAASRAERFRRSFPNSFFGPVVEQAVAEPAP